MRAPRSIRRVALLVASLLALGSCDDPAGTSSGAEVLVWFPGEGLTYAGGDTVDVELRAFTERDPASLEFSWWVVLHHNTHVHPFVPPTPGLIGEFVIPRAGHDDHNIFLRVYGRVQEAPDRADTAYVDIYPRTAELALLTIPAGLTVTLDGQPHVAPFVDTVIVGMDYAVAVAAEQTMGSTVYGFDQWTPERGPASRVLRIPEGNVTLTATFDSIATTNATPSVALTAPSAGAVLNAGTTADLTAVATDSDGSIATVAFLVDGAVVATDNSEPFTFAWTVSGAGERLLSARATDAAGAVGTSVSVPVVVQPSGAPITTLTAPTQGTRDLTGAVQLTATVTDAGPVSFVEFSVDGELIATDSSAPYAATLANTNVYASGAHVLRARARDADGNYSAWSSASVTFGGAVALPAGFTRTTVASGLTATPTSIAAAPDGRLFVTEQTGAVRVIKNGALLAQPFTTLSVEATGERGLVGVVLDPAFATNGWIYLYHTTAQGGVHNRISRFTASGDQALAGSEVVILDLPALGSVAKHSGGAMHFGRDGSLYVAVGDDGESSNAPSLSIPFGKMLRIRSDGTIPTDNPFYGVTSGVNRTIWARGLRNPFTFAIDSTTGRMHINDVGQGAWEEINLGRAGANYGWPATEGPTNAAGYDTPLLAYAHADSPTLFDGFAAVGAAFYRPAVVNFGASYVGDFFFADYVSKWIYRLDAEAGWAPYAFATLDEFITGLTVGHDGALYVLVGTRVDRIAR